MSEHTDDELMAIVRSRFPLATEVQIKHVHEGYTSISVHWQAHKDAGETPIWGRADVPDEKANPVDIQPELDRLVRDLFDYFQLVFIASGDGAREVLDRYSKQFEPVGALGRMPAMDKLETLQELAVQYVEEKRAS